MFAKFAHSILLEYSQRDFNDDASRFVHKRKTNTGWGALGGAAVGEGLTHAALGFNPRTIHNNTGKLAAATGVGALAGGYLARAHTTNKWRKYQSTLPRKFRDTQVR